MKRRIKTVIKSTLALTGGAFVVLNAVAGLKKADSVYDNEPEQKNLLEGRKVVFVENGNEPENADGIRGHLEDMGAVAHTEGFYQKYVKRGIDIALSFGGLIVLGPVIGATALAIKIDDPGPVFFTQKRIGQNKQYFKLHKFRSMKMSTPHDVPTHMLGNPDQYITKVGRFLRSHSMDELPQIWDIFIGNMSVIGPRPALWNQDVLIAEREKYGVNEIKPGLTGWAQINGRDALELEEKARFDGEYASRIGEGGFRAFAFDFKCFMDTITSVVRSEGVVEGGTGAMHDALRPGVPQEDPETVLGCDLDLQIDRTSAYRVLITGAGSYIGESVRMYASEHYPNLKIDTVDMLDALWRNCDFGQYDCVYHVAGIAHADVGNVSDEVKEKYYAVNTDLAIEVAQKAKAEGVKQFIFMSSAIIYGESAPFGKDKMIDRNTKPSPANFYGDSKWQADKGVRALADDSFKVAVLRPPMIYGKGSKGNYPTLAKMASKLPVFPCVDNKRSMLYIENLCEFVCNLIMTGEGGIFFPQNTEYTRTSDMVGEIAKARGHRIFVSRLFSPAVSVAAKVPGKIGGLVNKAFGNLSYDQSLSNYTFDYTGTSLPESIRKTEDDSFLNRKVAEKVESIEGKKILLISVTGYSKGIAEQMRKLGAEVDVINDKPNEGFLCKTLGRIQIKPYQKRISAYYSSMLAKNEGKYDYILVIRGEYTPIETLKELRARYPEARMVLYMWDGLHKLNTRGIEKKWKYYDKVFTFDRVDYMADKDNLNFLPLFYYENYLPDSFREQGEAKYDLSFIGTGHQDRIKIVKSVMETCRQNNRKCFAYFFLPHIAIYLRNKLLNKDFENVTIDDVHFELMPFEDLYKVYSDSKCIIDVENSGQHGLTMRSIEIVGLRRKLITTNKDIVNYDFYDPDNILVIDRNDPVVDDSFFDKPYNMLSEELYRKYSLSSWIFNVLS